MARLAELISAFLGLRDLWKKNGTVSHFIFFFKKKNIQDAQL